MLVNIPGPILAKVVKSHIATSKYFPKIAELLQPARELMEQRRLDVREREKNARLLEDHEQDRVVPREEALAKLREISASLAGKMALRSRKMEASR